MPPLQDRPRARSAPPFFDEAADPQPEEVAALLAGRCKVVWQVYMHEYEYWWDYTDMQSARIESAWLADFARVEVGHDGGEDYWTVNLVALTQTRTNDINHTGIPRPVRRVLVTHR